MLTINSLEEMKPYYNAKINTYEFLENGIPIDVIFTFSIDIESNIKAGNIEARDIIAWNINAGKIFVGNIIVWNINVGNINAGNIFAWNIVSENINAGDIDAENIIARDIISENIIAWDIISGDIKAWNIVARNIESGNISFYAICCAQSTLKCKSIEVGRKNAKYFCLDNEVEFIKE